MDFLDINLLENITNGVLAFLPRLGLALLIYLLSRWISSWATRVVRQGMESRGHDPEIIVLLEMLTRWGVLGLGIISALNTIAPGSFSGLIAGLGIVGFTLGFALQDVAKNFVSGVLLLIQQPFDIGDAIEISGFSGTVLDITLRTTELHTWDGRTVLIPNGDVYVKPIINYSRDPQRRIQLMVKLEQGGHLERISPLVLAALKALPEVLDEPRPEVIWTTSGDRSGELTTYYWVDTTQVNLVEAQNTGVGAVTVALEEEGIDIPFTIKTAPIEGR